LWKCGGCPFCWNSMWSGPFSSRIGMKISFIMSRYTIPVTACLAKRKEPRHFAWTEQKTHSTLDCLLYVQLLMRIIAPSDSQVVSINISQ
jgi:hypothetical protein